MQVRHWLYAVGGASQDKVDAAVIYINNEPIPARRAARMSTFIAVSDYTNLCQRPRRQRRHIGPGDPIWCAACARLSARLRDTIDKPDEAFAPARNMSRAGQGRRDGSGAKTGAGGLYRLWQAPKLACPNPAAWQTTLDVLKQMKLSRVTCLSTKLYTNALWTKSSRGDAAVAQPVKRSTQLNGYTPAIVSRHWATSTAAAGQVEPGRYLGPGGRPRNLYAGRLRLWQVHVAR